MNHVFFGKTEPNWVWEVRSAHPDQIRVSFAQYEPCILWKNRTELDVGSWIWPISSGTLAVTKMLSGSDLACLLETFWLPSWVHHHGVVCDLAVIVCVCCCCFFGGEQNPGLGGGGGGMPIHVSVVEPRAACSWLLFVHAGIRCTYCKKTFSFRNVSLKADSLKKWKPHTTRYLQACALSLISFVLGQNKAYAGAVK